MNSPIDFSASSYPSCTATCKFEFSYAESVATVIKSKIFDQQCILATYDTNSANVVTYNGIKYRPDGCLIYNSSFHTYSRQKSAGELIVFHSGMEGIGAGKLLLVCIPIQVGDSKTSSGGETVSRLINTLTPANVPLASDSSDRVSLNGNYNFSNIIPKNAPYYTYIGNQFYSTTSDTINYIVFTEESALKISSTANTNLKKMVKPIKPPVTSMPVNAPSKNMLGANATSSNQLYIECKPTGDDGVILYSKSLSGQPLEGGEDSAAPSADVFSMRNKYLLGLIVAILALLFVGLILAVVKFIMNRNSGGGAGSGGTGAGAGASS